MPKTAKLKMQLDTMNTHTVSQSLLIYKIIPSFICEHIIKHRFSAIVIVLRFEIRCRKLFT